MRASVYKVELATKLSDGRVQCLVCQRRCIIPKGDRGYCLTRENRDGTLYSLVYGLVASLAISPIEKKPMFHFYPGSRWFSIGTLGCNFRCPGCQNWEIAHAKPGTQTSQLRHIMPDELVSLALENRCLGISWTYNEPTTWFEYTLDGARLAKSKGLLTNYVTNGFITQEALDQIGPVLDSYRVDLKAFSPASYCRIAHVENMSGILAMAERAKHHWHMHVEVVTNVIPGYNDSLQELRKMAHWIASALGADTPWHVTRFAPCLNLSHLSETPLQTLEKARQIGFDAGLEYVYLGNVPLHDGENTYCSRCGKLLIRRGLYEIRINNIENGRCRACGNLIPGRF
jgi:pyruvate formate lyase activating enzyme